MRKSFSKGITTQSNNTSMGEEGHSQVQTEEGAREFHKRVGNQTRH